jgi:PAS domain S-box-containing protein
VSPRNAALRAVLEQRLSEADATIQALLAGEIDAVVDAKSRTPVLLAKAQQALRSSEGRLRAERDRAQQFLDTAEVMLLALDQDARITLINRKGCDLLGWPETDLVGHDWIERCVPARIRDSLRHRFHDLLAGRLPVFEHPVVTRHGEERLIEWRNTVQHDASGRVIGTFSSGTDITERHQAVEALRTAEERMRFALEAAGVGIWDMNYGTGTLEWSDILSAQYGMEPGGIGGTFDGFVARIHPADRQAALETINGAIASGGDFFIMTRPLRPDGELRWLSGTGRFLLDAAGVPVRGIGISQDVTERHLLDAQYQQAQKMDAIGRLAGGVAHDFNNLLTEILGYCELLLADTTADDPRRPDITEIQKAGVSAARLTRQLLAFSRKEIVEPKLLDVNVIVSDMRAMLGRMIGEDVAVTVRLHDDRAPVRADRGHLEQILMNLAVNARDAMPAGGTLTIETASVELDAHQALTHGPVAAGPYVRLTVTDTGSGMAPEVQARLFEPFFTTKAAGQGTGLGLATVHGIVTRNGGGISVSSTAGRGTSFHVYLPRSPSLELVAASPAARAGAGVETVMVVEDVKGLRALTKRLLQRQGYTVITAAGAEEALQLFDQHASVDVLLTDVVMPGASGPELTRQLVARRPGLKVVYMSGYTEEKVVHHGILDPGIAFLQKPFTSEELARKIREVLDR